MSERIHRKQSMDSGASGTGRGSDESETHVKEACGPSGLPWRKGGKEKESESETSMSSVSWRRNSAEKKIRRKSNRSSKETKNIYYKPVFHYYRNPQPSTPGYEEFPPPEPCQQHYQTANNYRSSSSPIYVNPEPNNEGKRETDNHAKSEAAFQQDLAPNDVHVAQPRTRSPGYVQFFAREEGSVNKENKDEIPNTINVQLKVDGKNTIWSGQLICTFPTPPTEHEQPPDIATAAASPHQNFTTDVPVPVSQYHGNPLSHATNHQMRMSQNHTPTERRMANEENRENMHASVSSGLNRRSCDRMSEQEHLKMPEPQGSVKFGCQPTDHTVRSDHCSPMEDLPMGNLRIRPMSIPQQLSEQSIRIPNQSSSTGSINRSEFVLCNPVYISTENDMRANQYHENTSVWPTVSNPEYDHLPANMQLNNPPRRMISQSVPDVSLRNMSQYVPDVSQRNMSQYVPDVSQRNMSQYVPDVSQRNMSQYVPDVSQRNKGKVPFWRKEKKHVCHPNEFVSNLGPTKASHTLNTKGEKGDWLVTDAREHPMSRYVLYVKEHAETSKQFPIQSTKQSKMTIDLKESFKCLCKLIKYYQDHSLPNTELTLGQNFHPSQSARVPEVVEYEEFSHL